jgi:hypothetical protein
MRLLAGWFFNMEISERQLKMRTPQGFDELFEQAINKGNTQPEVFEQIFASILNG